MPRPNRSFGLYVAVILAFSMAVSWFALPQFWSKTLSTQGFLPHSYCYVLQPGVIWLNAGSDVVIGVAYLFVSAALAALVLRSGGGIPFSWMIVAFGIFIVACGLTHLMEVWTIWEPRYWLAGELKLVTAVASIGTAIALPPLIPRVLDLVRDSRLSRERQRQLEVAHDEVKALNAHLKEVRLAEQLASRQALQQSLEELRASEARFAAILEIAEDGVISVDADQRVTLFNRAAEEIFHYRAAEVIGQPLELLLPIRFAAGHRGHVEEFARSSAVLRRMGAQREIFGRRRDGTEFPAEASISKLNIHGGPEFTVFLRDVSERKRTESTLAETRAELARVGRMTTMGELAASIAHEVNQPLAAIVANGSACARWLAGEPPNLHEAAAAIQRTIHDANRASDVVAGIRAFLKRGDSRKTAVRVDEVVAEVIDMVQFEARHHGVTLRAEADENLPPVLADRVQLLQVLLNLAMNAIEAMSAVHGRARVLTIGTALEGTGFVAVMVRDSGPGLDARQRERIFDAFYTTKPEGMGMGLAISRTIVEAHSGRIWAMANEGPGETFRFTFPTAAEGSA
jgi:PAS domain S-box-containing protein